VAAARATIAADTAGNMSFRGHPVADVKALDIAATFDDLTTEFMPDRKWNRNGVLCPVIPLEDMDIGAANGSASDLDQDIVVSDFRCIDILHPDAAFSIRFY
jgi:hypothetical protein